MTIPADLDQLIAKTRWRRYVPQILPTEDMIYASQYLGSFWLLAVVWSVLPKMHA